MRTSSSTSLSATTAIAAALALLSIPAFGQEAAAPPLDGPPPAASVTAPVPEPAPVLVIPDVSTVEAEPAPAEPAAVPATRSAPAPAQARTAPPVRTSAPVAAAAEPADEPAPATGEPVAAPEADAELPPVVPIDEPANIQPTPEQATDITAVLGLILVTLVGLILAVAAYAALRRRRAAIVASEAAPALPAAVTRETAPRPAAGIARPAPLTEPVPVLDRAPSRTLRSNGAAVPLPASLPASYEERDALLKRMMDAPPDRANPFTDRRARLRRARLILQSLGRKFDGAKPWIDLSDYPENWPELARQPQTPAAPIRTRELEPA